MIRGSLPYPSFDASRSDGTGGRHLDRTANIVFANIVFAIIVFAIIDFYR